LGSESPAYPCFSNRPVCVGFAADNVARSSSVFLCQLHFSGAPYWFIRHRRHNI
jgi:hypothetical protein